MMRAKPEVHALCWGLTLALLGETPKRAAFGIM